MPVKQPPREAFQSGRGYAQDAWDAVDSPPLTDEELARMKPAHEVLSPSFFTGIEKARRTRGRPKVAAPKVAVTLRIDPAVLEAFKACGQDWRGQMNEALRKAAHVQRKRLTR